MRRTVYEVEKELKERRAQLEILETEYVAKLVLAEIERQRRDDEVERYMSGFGNMGHPQDWDF